MSVRGTQLEADPMTDSPLQPNPSRTPPERTPRKWPRRLRRWTIEIGLIIAIVAAVQWYRAQPLAAGAAPPLQGREVVSGDWISLDAATDAPRLVHFWATWCPVCKLTAGSIAALSRDHEVITVAMQSGNAAEINAYLADHQLGLPTIVDDSGAIAKQWGVQAVPASFIINRDGQIRFRMAGYTTGPGLRARLWLARYGL